MKKLLLKNLWQSVAAIAFLIGVWLVLYLAVGNELLVPSFLESWREMGALFTKAAFWTGLFGSLLRAFCAFGVSFVFAVVLAGFAHRYKWLAGCVLPVVSALRSLPVLAILLILLAFLRAGTAPIAVAFLSVFPMLYTGILNALSGVQKQYLESARVQGAGVFRRAAAIYAPLCAPAILREAGAACSFSLKLVVSAEVLANTAKSLGGMMQEAKIYAEIPQLFALVAVSFAVGLALETGAELLAKRAENRIK